MTKEQEVASLIEIVAHARIVLAFSSLEDNATYNVIHEAKSKIEDLIKDEDKGISLHEFTQATINRYKELTNAITRN